MKVQSPEVRDDLHRRLRRIEGQIQGVQRMLDDDRECREIVQQLNAAQAALRNATRYFMHAYARDCLLNGGDGEREATDVLDELFSLMSRIQ